VDKDRESVHPVPGAEDAQIVYRRSSARPIEYAILLQVRGSKGWKTRIAADNSHADRHVDEHHCHRYLGGEKQPAEPLPFDVSDTNDAMAKIIGWFAENWRELTS
jgi:hypothetical protein